MQSIVNKTWEHTADIREAAALSPVVVPELWVDYYRCHLLTQPQWPETPFIPLLASPKIILPRDLALHNNDSLFIPAPGHFKWVFQTTAGYYIGFNSTDVFIDTMRTTEMQWASLLFESSIFLFFSWILKPSIVFSTVINQNKYICWVS